MRHPLLQKTSNLLNRIKITFKKQIITTKNLSGPGRKKQNGTLTALKRVLLNNMPKNEIASQKTSRVAALEVSFFYCPDRVFPVFDLLKNTSGAVPIMRSIQIIFSPSFLFFSICGSSHFRMEFMHHRSVPHAGPVYRLTHCVGY